MAQKTNLNVSPYYDDYDPNKDFYKVLFNPGRPVQARELTTLQSILQNQIEKFGSNVFKDGSVVIPGNVAFDSQFYAVKLNPSNYGVDISLYIEKLIGKKITGQDSGVSARIQDIIFPDGANVEYITIYVKYLDSDSNFTFTPFSNGELLVCEDNITYGITTINSGTPIASLVSSNATAIGSAASVNDGIYFIRGFFAKVSKQTIILDEYSNTPSYRVGLRIDEDVVSAKDDSTLYDNAKGFSNYAAPGADRLKINLTLIKKDIEDLNDTDFVELMRIQNGQIKKFQVKSSYNIIRDYLAQRTYDESGDYTVTPFTVSINNSLNNRLGNNGLFFDNEKTDNGNTPSDDLMCLKISPGKAYVKGYDIDKVGTTIIDVNKPRDTQTVGQISVPFRVGSLVRINNVYGPIKRKGTVELFNQRKSSYSATSGTGVKIGDARILELNVTDVNYSNFSTNWDLYLYDIQTYTQLTINQAIGLELPVTSFIKGKSSGATGYAVNAGNNSTLITLRQTSGTFLPGEQLLINGIDTYSRSIVSVKDFGNQDIKSLYQSTAVSGLPVAFTADCFLDSINNVAFNGLDKLTISFDSSGNATAACPGKVFTGIKTDTIIRYQRPGFTTETYNRISAISPTGLTMNLVGVTTVTGVCDGGVGVATGIGFALGVSQIRNQNKSALYIPLPDKNISSVNLSGSNISIVDQVTGQTTSAGGSLTFNLSSLTSGITSAFFLPFTPERYSIFYSNGGIGTVTSDQFSISGNNVTFSGLSPSQSSVVVNVSLLKSGIKSKVKTYTRSQSLTVNLSKYLQSGTGINTSINDGLAYNQYYGLRVQDEEISLNYPDVANVIAVYESLDQNAPVLDNLSFSPIVNVDANVIVGETIFGNTSKTIARVVLKSPNVSSNTISVVYQNANRFLPNESVTFKESNITTNIQTTTLGKYKDITNNFTLEKGQKEQFYDYSRIVRNKTALEPARQLYIIFDYYAIPSNDDGDLFTVLSYDKNRYLTDIPVVGGFAGSEDIRLTDTLDFRPRVAQFTGSSASPFDFSQRNFGTSPKVIFSPTENSLLGYDYYLGRIDKLYLDKSGEFILKKGTSARVPQAPTSKDEVMEIATITLPPYLFYPNQSSVSLVDNKRYTMRDIGKIETRVQNLERVTSLSLLEVSTQTLQIQDSSGLNRFKSGFFVDDFKNSSLINRLFSSIEVDPDLKELRPIISRNSLKSQIAPDTAIIDENLNLDSNFSLLDSNVQKTGNAVTLKYTETSWLQQPLATQIENVNPFNVVSYNGTIQLSPASDSWVRTIKVPHITEIERHIWVRATGTRETLFWATDISTTDVFVGSSQDTYMRSRNTQFTASNLKPSTRFYQFFDGNGSVDFVPKLIEISPSSSLTTYGASAAFAVGETVIGSFGESNLITFRVASPNHKFGPYNSPTKTYNINPYASSQSLETTNYSASSNVLNVDTYAISEEAQGKYSGYIVSGMRLVGQTSGAIAYVKDLRLISDNYGDLIGTFFLRDPNADPAPSVRFSAGTKTYKLTTSSTNQPPIPGDYQSSSAQQQYQSQGVVDIWRQDITITRTEYYVDPLAQSFSVGGNIESPDANGFTDDDKGVFLTSVDLFFQSKDTGNATVTVEVRTVELGTVTTTRIGDPVVLRPEDVNISNNASAVTNVKFRYPIYLAPGKEYAIVLLSPQSDAYNVWIAEMGKPTVNAPNSNVNSVIYSRQFALGSLFKSQNGSIWTANQYQDLMFKLYKANFSLTPGTAFFYNPTLNESNGYIPTLDINPIRTFPRNLKIGVTTTTSSSMIGILTTGRKVSDASKPYNYGYIVGTGASAISVGVLTGGLNYTSQSNVSTYTITGNGSGLTLNITQTGGVVTGISVATGGNGYGLGDVVGIVTSSAGSTGIGAKLTIADNGGKVDTLYLSSVQGQSFTPTAALVYYDNSGNAISLASTTILTSSSYSNQYNGNYIKVNHFEHQMYSPTNKLVLNNIQSNIVPTVLASTLNIGDTTISIADTSRFTTFEGVSVASTNPGYIKVDNEIIQYQSIGQGTLQTITRGQDSTIIEPHATNTNVYKYEINGVSLRRINNVTQSINSTNIDIDSYYVPVDLSTNGINRTADNSPSGFPQLSFVDERTLGGSNVTATENIQFNSVFPKYNIVAPANYTSATAQIRTVSATSASGTEASFIDQGFEPVELNTINRLNSVRMVCSKINESTYLPSLPRNKSFTTGITLETKHQNLSPIIFLDTAITEFRTNRFNQPITDYAFDNRVNSPDNDPNVAVYISNLVRLQNPATSLKVIFSAYRHSSADIRVLYSLVRPDSSEVNTVFELFPGYDNLTNTSSPDSYLYSVIDPLKNNGRPDKFTPASISDEFIEYEFTARDLGLFTGYLIKIVLAGSNQAYPPKIKSLRTLAVR